MISSSRDKCLIIFNNLDFQVHNSDLVKSPPYAMNPYLMTRDINDDKKGYPYNYRGYPFNYLGFPYGRIFGFPAGMIPVIVDSTFDGLFVFSIIS